MSGEHVVVAFTANEAIAVATLLETDVDAVVGHARGFEASMFAADVLAALTKVCRALSDAHSEPDGRLVREAVGETLAVNVARLDQLRARVADEVSSS